MSNEKEVEDTHIAAFGAQSVSRPCQQEKKIHEFLIWREKPPYGYCQTEGAEGVARRGRGFGAPSRPKWRRWQRCGTGASWFEGPSDHFRAKSKLSNWTSPRRIRSRSLGLNTLPPFPLSFLSTRHLHIERNLKH